MPEKLASPASGKACRNMPVPVTTGEEDIIYMDVGVLKSIPPEGTHLFSGFNY
jgi:hypothetical protein